MGLTFISGTILVVQRDIPLHRSFEVTLYENPLFVTAIRCITRILNPLRSGVQDNNNDYPIRMLLSSFYFDLSLQVDSFVICCMHAHSW